MEINAEIRARIIAAADQLYQDADRERFPTVDQVRRVAKADMNTTSAVMKEWRRQQTAAPVTVAVEIPEQIRHSNTELLAALWAEAQDLANESLAAARKAWETEREEADQLRAELSELYDKQAEELEESQRLLKEAQGEALTAEQIRQEQQQEIEALTERLRETTGKLEEAERREADKGARIEELKAEVAGVRDELHQEQNARQAEADRLREQHRAELEAAAERHQTQIEAANAQQQALKEELAKIQAKAEAAAETASERHQEAQERIKDLEAKLDFTRDELGKAREDAAGLTGKVEELRDQNKELMAALKKPAPRKRAAQGKEPTPEK